MTPLNDVRVKVIDTIHGSIIFSYWTVTVKTADRKWGKREGGLTSSRGHQLESNQCCSNAVTNRLPMTVIVKKLPKKKLQIVVIEK